MRPSKRITIIDHDEFRLSRTMFLLEVRGFRVTGYTMLSDAKAVRYPEADVVLCYELLEAQVLPTMADVPVLYLWDQEPSVDSLGSLRCHVLTGKQPTADLIERIRTLVARKRGPKRMTVAAA